MWMYTSAAASFDIRIWLIRVVQFIGRERGRERERNYGISSRLFTGSSIRIETVKDYTE